MADLRLLLLLSVLVYVHTAVSPCPRGCKCVDDKDRDQYSTLCLSLNLTHIPHNLDNKTTQLSLNGHRIRTIPPQAFSMLSRLTQLSLTDCQIEEIEANAFTGLSRLQFLNLENNHIKGLPSYIFSGLRSLKQLILSHNHIDIIENFAFNQLNLTRLRLEHNPRMTDISPKAFQGTKITELLIDNSSLGNRSLESLRHLTSSLTKLSWQNNRLPLRIPEDLFRDFNFETLNLNNNGINDTSFLKHVSTSNLSLDGNPTGPIDFSHYPNLRTIQELHLSRTGFRKLDGRYFSGMDSLKKLILNENRIMTIPANMEKVFIGLQRVGLDGNIFYCNCELLWFKEWVKTGHRTFVKGTECVYPYIEDILFMDENMMTCTPPHITNISRSNISISFDSPLRLRCVATGNPAPTIKWYWPHSDEVTIKTPSIDRNQTETTSVLEIAVSKPSNSGRYVCEASNLEGNVTRSVDVQVYRVTYGSQSQNNSARPSAGRTWTIYVILLTLTFVCPLLHTHIRYYGLVL